MPSFGLIDDVLGFSTVPHIGMHLHGMLWRIRQLSAHSLMLRFSNASKVDVTSVTCSECPNNTSDGDHPRYPIIL